MSTNGNLDGRTRDKIEVNKYASKKSSLISSFDFLSKQRSIVRIMINNNEDLLRKKNKFIKVKIIDICTFEFVNLKSNLSNYNFK